LKIFFPTARYTHYFGRNQIRSVNIVVGYPGEAHHLVGLLTAAVREVSATATRRLDAAIRLWEWKEDARPGVHPAGPQGIVDEAIRPAEADLFIALFRCSLGTPDPLLNGQTGTEHEFHIAYQARENSLRPEIYVYFSGAVRDPELETFRRDLPKDLFLWDLDDAETNPAEIERTFRRHLNQFLESRPGEFSFASRFCWKPSGLTPRGRQGRSDSSLLVAANESIPFTGREHIVSSLLQWARMPDRRVSIRTLIGQGGSGKTRTAIELAHRLRSDGWSCLWATAGIERPSTQHLPETGPTRPVLLVFDYASSLADALAEALPDLLLLAETTGPPVRVLLLDRIREGWYHRLLSMRGDRYAVRELFSETGPLELPGHDLRRELFQGGLDAWTTRHGRSRMVCPSPGVSPGFDEGLSGRTWADPLYLLIAAFVAAEHERIEPALAKTRLDLIEYAAVREQGELTRRVAEGKALLLVELAARNTVVGGRSAQEVEAWAAQLGEPPLAARALADTLQDLYPGDHEHIAPIQPDPVAEAFLLQYWREERNRSRHIDRFLSESAAAGGDESVVRFLVRTGQTFGWLEPALLDGISSRDEPLRVRTALDALERFLRTHPLAPERLLELLPRSTETVALRELRLRAIEMFPDRFGTTQMLLEYADALAALGRHREAVDLIRGELDKSPDLSATIRLLESLANCLSSLGEREVALGALERAVRHPGLNEAEGIDIGSVLNNFANRCFEAGRSVQALSASKAAEKIYRDLQHIDSRRAADALARTLASQAAILDALGQRTEAATTIEEAVGLFRALSEENPDSYSAQLAASLINASMVRGKGGLIREALEAAEEAVSLHRELELRLPGVFLSGLAVALRFLSSRFTDAAAMARAAEAASEAAEIHSRLAASFPRRYNRELADSLTTLARCESQLGRHESAVAHASRSLDLIRQVAAAEPGVFEPELAQSLVVLVSCLLGSGSPEEAVARAREAVAIHRRTAAIRPEAEADLAQSLRTLATALLETGGIEEACDAARESVEIRSRLGKDFEQELARSLDSLASTLIRANRPEEALAAADRALEIPQRLTGTAPLAFRPLLAQILRTRSACLSGVGRDTEAMADIDAFIGIRLALEDGWPPDQITAIARAFGVKGRILHRVGRMAEARALFAEACVIVLPLARERPQKFMDLVASLANDYLAARSDMGDPVPEPVDDQALITALFGETGVEINGYDPPS
jgi:tetratricopeptide (TPR) repeat protein